MWSKTNMYKKCNFKTWGFTKVMKCIYKNIQHTLAVTPYYYSSSYWNKTWTLWFSKAQLTCKMCTCWVWHSNVSIYTMTSTWVFTGNKCIRMTDYDDCSSKPCMNGATCHDSVDSYTCQCQSGYRGGNCETGKRNSSTYLLYCFWSLLINAWRVNEFMVYVLVIWPECTVDSWQQMCMHRPLLGLISRKSFNIGCSENIQNITTEMFYISLLAN